MFRFICIVLFLIAYLIYLRFLPEHGYVILAVPILYGLHLPYLMPILLGLIGAPVAVIPMSCGVVCYYAIVYYHGDRYCYRGKHGIIQSGVSDDIFQ